MGFSGVESLVLDIEPLLKIVFFPFDVPL
jgi:hypothetical protein